MFDHTRQWRCRDKSVLQFTEMGDEHIQNSINMIKSHRLHRLRQLPYLLKEQGRRAAIRAATSKPVPLFTRVAARVFRDEND